MKDNICPLLCQIFSKNNYSLIKHPNPFIYSWLNNKGSGPLFPSFLGQIQDLLAS